MPDRHRGIEISPLGETGLEYRKNAQAEPAGGEIPALTKGASGQYASAVFGTVSPMEITAAVSPRVEARPEIRMEARLEALYE
jgi:hypothetical protein